MRILAFLGASFTVFFIGCANPYSQYYTDYTEGIAITESLKVILPTSEPKLIQGFDIETDGLRMLEDGYLLLGESNFNSGPTNQNLAIEHAKKVHADTVIVLSEYTNTVSGSMPMTVPNTQTSYHSGSIYGSGGGFASYSGSSTTYGNSTTYIPYSVRRCNYYAGFWIKSKPMSLGIHIDNLTDEHRRKVESNRGVYIIVVVKDSPAFNSDLMRDDIIQKFNDIEVASVTHFGNLIDESQGQQIKLEIFRNGKTIEKQIQLN